MTPELRVISDNSDFLTKQIQSRGDLVNKGEGFFNKAVAPDGTVNYADPYGVFAFLGAEDGHTDAADNTKVIIIYMCINKNFD